MRILFISPNSPFESVGGVERYLTNLISFYKDRNEDNIFLILPTTKESYVTKEGSVTIYFDNNLFITRILSQSKNEVTKKSQIFSKYIEKIIKDQKIDIICAENFLFGPPTAYTLLLNMIASLYKIPLVLRLHSFAVTELQTEIINQLMWSKISCVSKSVAGDCFQKGAEVNNLSTNYLGVNTEVFNTKNSNYKLREQLNLPSDSKIVMTATRIIRGSKNILHEKGIVNLIQSFSKLSPRYPKLRLLIAVGKAPDNLKNEFQGSMEMLLGFIKIHNIESSTIVKTFKLDEMPGVYKDTDVFVLPSENETFGQVFIEAMACGVPVIGTKVGGIPEIISDSYSGYLVQPNDSSILAQRIEKLLNDNSTRNKFIKAGIKTVGENFTSGKQFLGFHNMLNNIMISSPINTS